MGKNSIWFLKSILRQFEDSSCHFRDYLNSRSHDMWALYNINSLGWISYAQIIDNNLMPSNFFQKLEELLEYAKTQYKYSDPVLDKEHDLGDAIKVLEILSNLKKETLTLLELETKRLNLEDKTSKKVA